MTLFFTINKCNPKRLVSCTRF